MTEIKRGRGRPRKIVQEQDQTLSKVGQAIETFVNSEDFAEVFINNLVGKVAYELRVYNNYRNPEVMERVRELLDIMSGYVDSLPKEDDLD